MMSCKNKVIIHVKLYELVSSRQQIEMFLDSNETELQLPKCNSFLRRLVYQTKAEKFSDKITLETRQLENKDRILFVRRLKTREEEEEIEKQKYEEQIRELEDFVGFTKVLQMIVTSVSFKFWLWS